MLSRSPTMIAVSAVLLTSSLACAWVESASAAVTTYVIESVSSEVRYRSAPSDVVVVDDEAPAAAVVEAHAKLAGTIALSLDQYDWSTDPEEVWVSVEDFALTYLDADSGAAARSMLLDSLEFPADGQGPLGAERAFRLSTSIHSRPRLPGEFCFCIEFVDSSAPQLDLSGQLDDGLVRITATFVQRDLLGGNVEYRYDIVAFAMDDPQETAVTPVPRQRLAGSLPLVSALLD